MKASAIMVMPTVPLDMLPAGEREIVSRFLFRTMRPVDEQHRRRWARMWRRAARGEVMALYPVVDRDFGYHAMHMATEQRLFANQDGFVMTKAGQRAFRNWLKVGASLVTLELEGGEPQFLPGSLSYEDLSDDEMREFHEAAMDWLRDPRALQQLWPAVPAEQRMAMLEAALRDPEDHQENTQ